MSGCILQYMVALIAIFCISSAHGLQCYYCNDCVEPILVTCNSTAAENFTEVLGEYFEVDKKDKQDTYNCMTLAYMTKSGDRYGKIRGCIYNSQYACSLKSKNQDYSYICYTCDSDFCNSSGNYTDANILLTLISTFFAALIAQILK